MRLKIRQEGVPEFYLKLFEKKTKKEIELFLGNAELSSNDFALFIQNCDQIGFRYRSFFKDFRPKHLELSKEEKLLIGDKTVIGQKVRKKMIQMFTERKRINVHLFEKGEEWHCFFFDGSDINDKVGPNHWVGGAHIHYISHHWTLSLDQVWNQFEDRRIKLPKIHVKFTMKTDIE